MAGRFPCSPLNPELGGLRICKLSLAGAIPRPSGIAVGLTAVYEDLEDDAEEKTEGD